MSTTTETPRKLVSLADMTKRESLLREIRKNAAIYAFVLPGLAFVLLFNYYPLYFLQIAFRNYRPTRAFSKSEWVGFRYFEQLVTTAGFWRAFRNTNRITITSLIAGSVIYQTFWTRFAPSMVADS